jgi:hypothetical protein
MARYVAGFNQPSAWAMKSAGLGIVSNRLIGMTERGRGWFGEPLEMDERPISSFPWKAHETLH